MSGSRPGITRRKKRGKGQLTASTNRVNIERTFEYLPLTPPLLDMFSSGNDPSEISFRQGCAGVVKYKKRYFLSIGKSGTFLLILWRTFLPRRIFHRTITSLLRMRFVLSTGFDVTLDQADGLGALSFTVVSLKSLPPSIESLPVARYNVDWKLKSRDMSSCSRALLCWLGHLGKKLVEQRFSFRGLFLFCFGLHGG